MKKREKSEGQEKYDDEEQQLQDHLADIYGERETTHGYQGRRKSLERTSGAQDDVTHTYSIRLLYTNMIMKFGFGWSKTQVKQKLYITQFIYFTNLFICVREHSSASLIII